MFIGILRGNITPIQEHSAATMHEQQIDIVCADKRLCARALVYGTEQFEHHQRVVAAFMCILNDNAGRTLVQSVVGILACIETETASIAVSLVVQNIEHGCHGHVHVIEQAEQMHLVATRWTCFADILERLEVHVPNIVPQSRREFLVNFDQRPSFLAWWTMTEMLQGVLTQHHDLSHLVVLDAALSQVHSGRQVRHERSLGNAHSGSTSAIECVPINRPVGAFYND